MRPLGALLVVLLLLALAPASATALTGKFYTHLISRSMDGGFPDRPSRNPAISSDERVTQLVAFESDATNLVPNDTNGMTDVFAVHRAPPWLFWGTEWFPGPTVLVSSGMNGEPANGRSWGAALDGGPYKVPSCVAFISEASNLVPGDTNGVADAFVRDLNTGFILRVSVDSFGNQGTGPTDDVDIDGACQRVAFSSRAGNLTFKKAPKREWRSAEIKRGRRPGRRQVYGHIIWEGPDGPFNGLTFMISARKKRAGNAESGQPAITRQGRTVVFSSLATNLSPRDTNGKFDIYEHMFRRRTLESSKGPYQSLRLFTGLASVTDSWKPSNGHSTNPVVTDGGHYVAFETRADNLVAGDHNNTSDVIRRRLVHSAGPVDTPGRTERNMLVSRALDDRGGNGPSGNPAITGVGAWVFFESAAKNLIRKHPNSNEMNSFRWSRVSNTVSRQIRDRRPDRKTPRPYKRSVRNPETSSHGNYVLFETANPRADHGMAARNGDPGASLTQVYMQYWGGCPNYPRC
jgi:hypothetical protein